MGRLRLIQHRHGNARWNWPLTIAAASLAIFAMPVFAQPGSGHSAAGRFTSTPAVGPMRATTPSRSMGAPVVRPTPGRSMGAPAGTPIRNGQQFGTVRPNSFGSSSSAPPPSWELPKYVTPHWEIGPNVQVQPNAVQGNHIHRNRGVFGVGYVGFPYYADPFSFGNAWDWNDRGDTAQQAQPSAPARPDYGPQAPYGEGPGPYEQGYGPPPRPPYSPDAYSQQSSVAPPVASNSAPQSDGLDHPPVTLIFSDGRPPEQVNSYVLTGSSIFVAEHGHQRVIPVADLDLPATIAQNREAGVDFALPSGSR
jgi:hypothetical protein